MSKKICSAGVDTRRESKTDKVCRVTLRNITKEARTTFTWSPANGLEMEITVKPGQIVKHKLSRSRLVGKYNIKPMPAPESKLKLDEITRNALLDAMVLI